MSEQSIHPLQPSHLLLGLPDPALACMIEQLVAAGSYKLKELIACCKKTRELVFLHAPRITYKPSRRQGIAADVVANKFARQLAHRSGSVKLTLDFSGNKDDEALATLLLKGGQGMAACTSLVGYNR